LTQIANPSVSAHVEILRLRKMSIHMSEIFPRLAVARQAASEAGKILRGMFGKTKISRKESFNLVTEADLLAEKKICEVISANCPHDKFFLEEGENSGELEDEFLWIIDPLDGTNGFAHGIPHFSVSVAFASAGKVLIGVVFDPSRNEMFWSVRAPEQSPIKTLDEHGAAFLNEDSIQVSNHRDLKDCVISTGFYYDRGSMMRKTLTSMERLFGHPVQGIRRFGSAALDLCWVACGRFDGHFEYHLEPWDYAAASLILENAGGQILDRNGHTMRLNSRSVIATNGKVTSQMLGYVQWLND